MKETLARISLKNTSDVVTLGSLIETNLATYFLSISAGQLTAEGTTYFAMSTSSPIGRLLLGKKAGDEIVWNGRKIRIQKIH